MDSKSKGRLVQPVAISLGSLVGLGVLYGLAILGGLQVLRWMSEMDAPVDSEDLLGEDH